MTLSLDANRQRTPARSWRCCRNGLPVLACHSSDEDGVDRVQETGGPPGVRRWERHIRLSGIDPLLDEITPGVLGDQTPDSQEAPPSHQEVVVAMVSHNRHAPLQYQYQMLCQKLRGHFQYFGIRGNLRLLEDVRRFVEKAWRYWLSRRSSKSSIGWATFEKLMQTYVLPTPRIVHNI